MCSSDLTFGYARAFGLTSSTESGNEGLETTWDRFGLGARLRIPMGAAPSALIGLRLGYGFMHFNFPEAGPFEGQLADTTYKFVRFGVDARFPFGSFAVSVGGDYIAPLSAGAVYDRFTASSVGGVELFGGFGLMIATGLEVRFTIDYTRFFYSFEPVLGDRYIAGGALDEYLSPALGVAYVY